MPKLTYRAQGPDDPAFVRVDGIAFESGEAVEVSDAIYDVLKDNPWFKGGKAARDAAAAATAGAGLSPGPSSGIDSSVMPATAPGSGMKHDPDTVMTAQGMKPAEDADFDEAIGGYVVKHKGRGVYDVLKGDETVASGLSKDDADSWVAARSV